MSRLEGKCAFVTGAGNGIGAEIAKLLAKEGAKVMVNDLGTDLEGQGSQEGASGTTVEEIRAAGGTAEGDPSDVSTFEGVGSLVEHTVNEFGQVDVAVNCAGAAIEGSIFELPVEMYEKTISLQMSQKWYVARHVAGMMAQQGWGRIINTTSHGALGVLGQPAFAAAMGGVISMTKALATETQGTGITVNCLAPGAATRLHAKSHDDFKAWHEQKLIDDEMWQSYINTPPPEYVAPIVAWLCTDKADGISGEVFHAAGGQLGIWTSYGDAASINKGDHKEVDPWTLDELDKLIPAELLNR